MADGRVNDFKLQIIALWPGHLPEGRWQTIKDHFSLGVCDAALVGGSARWEGLFSVFFKRIFCFAFRTLGPRYNSWYVCFSLSFFCCFFLVPGLAMNGGGPVAKTFIGHTRVCKRVHRVASSDR